MRVLIASPDPDFAKTARLALRSDSIIVEVVTPADEALVLAMDVPYAALVLDRALPDARRAELLKRMRRNQVAAPIIALTSNTKPEARIEALQCGGRPVPAAELLGVLWHEKETPRDNFIAVLMMRLRKKVDDDFSTKLVHTIRGSGYAIGAGA